MIYSGIPSVSLFSIWIIFLQYFRWLSHTLTLTEPKSVTEIFISTSPDRFWGCFRAIQTWHRIHSFPKNIRVANIFVALQRWLLWLLYWVLLISTQIASLCTCPQIAAHQFATTIRSHSIVTTETIWDNFCLLFEALKMYKLISS